jgi:hypothetical protein
MSTNILEFSFDDSKIVKTQEIEIFKQNKGEKHRVSVVAFKRFHDAVLKSKTQEAGRPLTDQEKAELIIKVDARLAEQLKKKPEELTEIDRLDVKAPRFSVAFVHYKDGLGSVRCLSTYEGGQLVKPEVCCKEMGDATQTVGTIIMIYPVDEHLQADIDLLKQRKYTHIRMWRMTAKKFKQTESTYVGARNDQPPTYVLDLKVTIEGDPKFQNQKIESGSTAVWAREGMDPEIRQWVLEQGLRNYKHIAKNLGYEMSREKLIERLNATPAMSAEASAEAPQLSTNYNELLR